MSTVSRKNDFDDESSQPSNWIAERNTMNSAGNHDNQEAQLNWITKSLGVD